MAKKSKDIDDFNIDNDPDLARELEEFDSMFNMDADEPKPGSREAVTKSVKNLGRGFYEGTKEALSVNGAIDLANKAVPRSLSSELNDIVSLHSDLKGKIGESVSEVKKSARPALRAIDKIMPKDGLGRRILETIKSKVGDDDSRVQSQAALDANEIAGAMSEVFGEKYKQERIDDLLKQSLEEKRHKSTNEILSSISASSSNHFRYDTEITAAYQRRSLELNYKSLFIAKEQLSLLKGSLVGFKSQFESIIHNTALPDIIKTRNSEFLKESIIGRTRQGITDMFYSNNNPLMMLKKNLTSKIGEYTTGIKEGFDSVGTMVDMGEGLNDAANMGGGKARMAGGLASDFLKTRVMGKLGEKLGKTRVGKDGVFKIKDSLMDVNNFFRENSKSGGDLKRGIFGALADLSNINKTSSVNFGTEDINQAAIYDNKTKNSIVKVIPGLLTKIYTELKSTRLKDNNPEAHEIYYDHTKNDFYSKKDTIDRIKKDVSLKMNRGVTPAIESFMSKLKNEGRMEISKKDAENIRKGIVKYYTDGGSTAPSTLLSGKFLEYFNDDTKKRLAPAIKRLLLAGREDPMFLDYLGSDLKAIRSNIPNISNQLLDLHDLGYNKIAKSLGGMTNSIRHGGYDYDENGVKNLMVNSMDGITDLEIKSEMRYARKKLLEEKKAKDSKFNPSAKINELAEYLGIDTGKKPKDKLKKDPKNILGNTKEEKETIRNLRSDFFSSKEYLEGRITTISKWLESLGYDKKTVEAVETTIVDDTEIRNKKTIKETYNSLVSKIKVPDTEQTRKLRTEFMSSKEYLDGKVKTLPKWLESLGYDKQYIEDVKKNITENETVKNGLGKLEPIRETIEKEKNINLEKIRKLREEFFNSEEYKNSKVRNFTVWCEAQGFKAKELEKQATEFIETKTIDDVKEIVKSKTTKAKAGASKKIKAAKEADINALKEEFFKSKEYKNHYVTDFKEWATNLGYNVKEDVIAKGRRSLSENLQEGFMNTRSLDERLMKNILPGLLGKGIKNSWKLPYYGIKYGAKGVKGLADAYNSTAMKKMRGADSAIMSKIPWLAKNAPKALFNTAKYGGKALSGLYSGVTGALGIATGFGAKRDKKAEMRALMDENARLFDKDKSGKRDGDWRDRMNIFKKKDKPTNSTPKDMKKSTGIFDLLKMALPMLTTGLGKLVSFGKGIYGAVKLLPSLFTKLLPGISGIASKGVGLLGKAGAGVASVSGAGKAVLTGGAATAKIGSKAGVALGEAAAAGAPKASKIMSTLSSFKSKILKRLGAKAGAKMVAILTAKIAARMVPFIGTGLLAYDAGMIAKDMMLNNTGLASAVSKQIIGFDINDETSVPVDENGDPIKPDEDLKIKDKNNYDEYTKSGDTGFNNRDRNKTTTDNNSNTGSNSNNNDSGSFYDRLMSSIKSKASAVYDYTKDKIVAGAKATGQAISSMTGGSNILSSGSFNNSAVSQDKGKILEMLDRVAEKTGTKPNILKAFAAIESSLNPNLVAKTSSASGLFQFLKGTWASMLSKYGSKFGIAPNTSPFDAEANATMGAMFLKENENVIKKIKPDPNLTDLYLAHFLGAGGASKFLKAPGDSIGAQIMPREANANRPIFYTKDGRARTLTEIYTELTNRLNTKAAAFGFSPGTPSPSTSEGGTGEVANIPNTAPSVETKPRVAKNNYDSYIGKGGSEILDAPKPSTAISAPTPLTTNTPVTNSTSGVNLDNAVANSPMTSDTPLNLEATKANLSVASVNKDMLSGIGNTLTKSLDVQTKMVELLGSILETNKLLINNKPEQSKVTQEEVKPTKPSNNTVNTMLPEPPISMKRKIN